MAGMNEWMNGQGGYSMAQIIMAKPTDTGQVVI